MKTIDIDELKQGLPGITQSVGNYLSEAVIYCLISNGHDSGVLMAIEGENEENVKIVWEGEIDQDAVNSWNDKEELVEYAATGMALLLVLEFTDYTDMKRSRKGSRGDYWLGEKDENGFTILKALLEISGIYKASASNTVNSRVRLKQKQLENSPFKNLPAYIVVVEFSNPKAKIIKK